MQRSLADSPFPLAGLYSLFTRDRRKVGVWAPFCLAKQVTG